MRDTSIVDSAHNHYASPSGLCDGHAQSENGLVALWVCPEALAKLEITRPEIARKLRGFQVASRDELIEVGGILSAVIRRVRLERLEECGHGVNRVVLSDNELVLRRYLIGLRFGYSL